MYWGRDGKRGCYLCYSDHLYLCKKKEYKVQKELSLLMFWHSHIHLAYMESVDGLALRFGHHKLNHRIATHIIEITRSTIAIGNHH